MINFRFSLTGRDGSPSGFSLGHMEIDIDGNSYSSRGAIPNQAMMIFPSITELLDGLRKFYQNKEKSYEFIGIDSNFKMQFALDSSGLTAICYKSSILGLVTKRDLISALFHSAEAFFLAYVYKIDGDDAAMEDLKSSLGEFSSVFISQIRNK